MVGNLYKLFFTLNGLPNGEEQLSLSLNDSSFYDIAGNPLILDGVIKTLKLKDEIPPVISISSEIENNSWSNKSSIKVKFNISESSDDFTMDDISVSGGEISDFIKSSSIEYEAVFTPALDGEKIIAIENNSFSDLYGNYNSDSDLFTWYFDTKRPDIKIVGSRNDNINVINVAALKIEFKLTEPSETFGLEDVFVKGGQLDYFARISDTLYSAIFTSSFNDDILINVSEDSFEDLAGNGGNSADFSTIATVTKVSGHVHCFHQDGTEDHISPGYLLGQDSHIETGPRSFAEILMLDDSSVVKLMENTIFELSEDEDTRYVKMLEPENHTGNISMINNINKEYRRKIYKIITPVSEINVVGTKYSILCNIETLTDSFVGATGKVEIVNKTTGQAVEVSGGEKLEAKISGEVEKAIAEEGDFLVDPEDLLPKIEQVKISRDNKTASVYFDGDIFGDVSAETEIVKEDFNITLRGGTGSLSSNTPTNITKYDNYYLLELPIIGIPNGEEILEVNPTIGSIYSKEGVELIIPQPNNYDILYNAINNKPYFENISHLDTMFMYEDSSHELNYKVIDKDNDSVVVEIIDFDTMLDVEMEDQNISIAPKLNMFGEGTLTLQANDGIDSTIIMLNIMVEPVNDKPLMSKMDMMDAQEGDSMFFKFKYSDVDGDDLTHSVFTHNDSVEVWSNKDTVFVDLHHDYYGHELIYITAYDGKSIDTSFVELNVININDPPVLGSIKSITVDEDSKMTMPIDITDVDGDSIFYSVFNEDTSINIDVFNDTLSIQPQKNYYGETDVMLVAFDEEFSDTVWFNVYIQNLNDMPFLSDFKFGEVFEDSVKNYELFAHDQDGDVITFNAFSDTSLVQLYLHSDTLKFKNYKMRLKTTGNFNGKTNISITLNDGQSTDTTTFPIEILNTQDKPENFDWLNFSKDTVFLSDQKLFEDYYLSWTKSFDIDGDSVEYLVYCQVGQNEAEKIHNTNEEATLIPYNAIYEDVLVKNNLSAATIRFNIKSTDGVDTVAISGQDKILYVIRAGALSIYESGIPTDYKLHSNFPNPFNATTTIRYDLPVNTSLDIIIYDITGREIRRFSLNNKMAGYHYINWDGKNQEGYPVASGIYLYQMHSNYFMKTRRMLLLK